jgi:hypothetical protein
VRRSCCPHPKIGRWLLQPAISARIEAAFFKVSDPRLMETLARGIRGQGTP